MGTLPGLLRLLLQAATHHTDYGHQFCAMLTLVSIFIKIIITATNAANYSAPTASSRFNGFVSPSLQHLMELINNRELLNNSETIVL